MLSSLILQVIKMPHFEQICYHLIPKMHVSNGYVLVKFEYFTKVPKTTPGIWSLTLSTTR